MRYADFAERIGKLAKKARGKSRAYREGARKRTDRHRKALAGGSALVTAGVLTAWIAGAPQAVWNRLAAPSLPFTLVVQVNPALGADPPCFREVFVPGRWHSPAPPAWPVTEAEGTAWEQAQHGVDVGYTSVVLIIQGRTDQAVTITSPHVTVRHRNQVPGEDVVLDHFSGCGGVLPYRKFDVNLDSSHPVAEPATESGFTVSDTNPEYFLVTAGATRYLSDWQILLGWSSMGRAGTVQITDDGMPFQTTGEGSHPHVGLQADRWVTR
ncbi:MAG TPA: hypothetical protein VKU39_15355 [Streptosporangiaceae bacterium]|nr:hypothetical protein [Streptosporangiaceae bacterium]